MEYVGEHLLPGQLGRFFVALAFTTALVSAVAYFLGSFKNNSSYQKLGRISFIIHLGSAVGIVLTLFYLMLNHYFEYDYVWKHSSKELPLRYIFSAFWEGQEGSFILWLFWHAVLGTILAFTAKKWAAPVVGVVAVVQAFLASMLLGVFPAGLRIGSSPFVLMRNTADNLGLPWTQMPEYLQRIPGFMDGSGLNPLLQNYWMTIHPPTLFLGFASVLIPFAFAMAGLLKKDFTGWIKPALPWTYFSVGILGLGILMGGAWAYEALSFGGFWAWDPVENSSLVPWITMVGAAHLMLIFHNRKTGLKAAFFLTILSFILILYSTFLTRSGVLGDSSVHAFVDLGLSGQLLIYLLFFTLISFGLLLYHLKRIPSLPTEDKLSSREFWMFIGSLTLLLSAFQIIFSTSIPVINKLIGPEGALPFLKDEMAPPIDVIAHYNSFQIPFAIVIVLLLAVGQFLNYRSTGSKFWKNISRSLGVSLVISALFAQLFNFWKDPLLLILLTFGWFSIISNLDYWLIVRKAKFQFAGSSVAHLGFGLIIVGALISNARQQVISSSSVFLSDDLPANENALIDKGDTAQLGPYLATYNGMRKVRNMQYYDLTFYQEAGDSLRKAFEVAPYLLMADEMGPTSNPDTKHYLFKDIYSHVTYSSALAPKTADGYENEATVELEQGDSAVYSQHFVILDSLKVNAGMNEETRQLERLRLTAKLRLVNVLGEEFTTEAVYLLEGNQLTQEDAIIDKPGIKIRFEDVKENSSAIVLKAWKKADPNEKPFIVLKSIVFPFINLLWLGCILMVIGSFIAVQQRLKLKK